MGTYRSAQGKMVDMAALASKNQKVRAVGNMNVNARGDTIDSNGRVIEPVTEKVSEKYSKTVGNRSAHATKANKSMPKEELTDFERELNADLNDEDAALEIIKKNGEKNNGQR